MLSDTLKTIVDSTPGARAAILAGFDGIAVMMHVREGETLDIESLAMEFSFRLIELRRAATALDLGHVSDVTVKAERGTLLVRCLSDEYFVAVFLEDSGNLGKGRWILRSNASNIESELL